LRKKALGPDWVPVGWADNLEMVVRECSSWAVRAWGMGLVRRITRRPLVETITELEN
jgi:hypothetical protein